ncbi:hypothetical protein [Streptomyces cinereoruber]|uniref:hypothetical protein n=1 Tax=Streptomyces cinereoruber TaxID=67260 RepID=UPI0036330837
MHEIALAPHARLPRAHHDRHVLTSTVDAFDAAHWLLAERAPEPGGDLHSIEHLLVDEAGDLWVGHFDENPLGIRRWSATGRIRWASGDVPGAGWIMDCYALNVSGTSAWACPYTDFPLLEIRPGEPVRVRANTVRGAKAVAVHGGRVAFFGGYAGERDRIAYGELTESSVEPTDVALLTRADGGALGRRRVVARGSRVYVQEEPFAEWGVLDLSA